MYLRSIFLSLSHSFARAYDEISPSLCWTVTSRTIEFASQPPSLPPPVQSGRSSRNEPLTEQDRLSPTFSSLRSRIGFNDFDLPRIVVPHHCLSMFRATSRNDVPATRTAHSFSLSFQPRDSLSDHRSGPRHPRPPITYLPPGNLARE